MNEKEPIITQEAKDVVEKIKELVKKGNVSKVVIKKGENTIVNLPLNAGIVGGIVGLIAAPWAMLTATIATIGFDCKVELVKTDGSIIDISGKTIGKKVIDELKSDD
ncbi:MAG: DUF4342 domain-containing protein [Clostridiales bacterium]|nr:DUF4342 domain-containing protein [Clostridiales bacterium]